MACRAPIAIGARLTVEAAGRLMAKYPHSAVAVKAMVTDACNRIPDPAGTELACCLNHGMQSILQGLPGRSPA
jgi:hypothetical protein